jgi:hypothetical protein
MNGKPIAGIYGFVIPSLVLGLTALVFIHGVSNFRNNAQYVGAPIASNDVVGENGVIGTEGRVLLSQFTVDGVADQEAMRASLAATQSLSCHDGVGSASLIYRNDVIIFSAHEILKDEAKHSDELDDCVFVVANKKGATDRYPLLLATVDHGGAGPDGQLLDKDDWAIARLARPVTGIEPFHLPEKAEVGTTGSAVTTISESTDNWHGARGILAQNCRVIEAFSAMLHLDCDVGHGASGSAILHDVASGTPRYVGTTIAYRGSDCREVGVTTCFSIGRRLDADLVTRIKGTTAIRITPQEKALGAQQDARLAARRDAAAAKALAALSAAFPALDDAQGRKAADLYARSKQLVADGHPEQTDALFLEIYRALHDPAQSRPEWPWLLLENGESMLRQHRQSDAFQCFHAALAIAPDPLKPYLLLRTAQTTTDPKLRKKRMLDAYLAGGDGLFQFVGADAELADVKADGLLTADDLLTADE